MKHGFRARLLDILGPRMMSAAAIVSAITALPMILHGQSTWTQLASIPDPPGPEDGRTEGAAVSGVGDTIVVVGGHDGGSPRSDLTRIYDITTDTWSFGPASPLPALLPAVGETGHGGRIYVIGGVAGFDVHNAVQQYNVDAQSWALKTGMPTARSGSAVALLGNSLYVIGGRTKPGPCSGATLNVVERYDIDTDAWSTEEPLPSPRSDFAALAVGNKIYVFGGCAPNGAALADVDVFDRSTGVWDTSPADLSVPRSLLIAGRKGKAIYVMGGNLSGFPQVTAVNEKYDLATDTWSFDTEMPADQQFGVRGKGSTGAYSHGGRIYVPAGGRPAFLWQPTRTLWAFNP